MKELKSIGIVVLIGIIATGGILYRPVWLQKKAVKLVGLSQEEVEKKLGAPYKIVTSSEVEEKSPKFPWWGQGWAPRPEHPVKTRALIYYWPPAGVVIFVGKDGNVDHVSKIGT